MENTLRKSSVFTGNMFGLLGVNLATVFLTGITFGIAFPWLLCWKEAWYKEHTYINGRQLRFDGKGMQLIGNWIKWILLSLITFGIYTLWVPIKIEQWTVKHTSFADEIPVTIFIWVNQAKLLSCSRITIAKTTTHTPKIAFSFLSSRWPIRLPQFPQNAASSLLM